MFRSQRSFFPAYAVSVVQGWMGAAPATAIALLVFVRARPAVAQATIEYGHVATGSSAGSNGLGKKIDSALSPGKESASVPASHKQTAVVIGDQNIAEYNPADANRRGVQQKSRQ